MLVYNRIKHLRENGFWHFAYPGFNGLLGAVEQRELGDAGCFVLFDLSGPLRIVDIEHDEVNLVAVLLVKLFDGR